MLRPWWGGVFLYHVTPTHTHILCSHRPSYYVLKLWAKISPYPSKDLRCFVPAIDTDSIVHEELSQVYSGLQLTARKEGSHTVPGPSVTAMEAHVNKIHCKTPFALKVPTVMRGPSLLVWTLIPSHRCSSWWVLITCGWFLTMDSQWRDNI